ncbi:hypothetical protein BC833DRAFT_605522 [Globomyces pollinis-pini]|nr:hypothetical protein BC833DRAFT_605522 [Globomyces pollinis-pini]
MINSAIILPNRFMQQVVRMTQTVSDFLPSARILAPSISEWMSGLLLAAPKKKTTHHKKRLRMNSKWLKPMKNITPCPVCGKEKLRHHLCRNCVKSLFKST